MTNRRALDAYYTPLKLTDSLLDFLERDNIGMRERGAVLECCSGNGAISSQLLHRFSQNVFTNDINDRENAMWNYDATDAVSRLWFKRDWTWIISNPPYKWSMEITENAIKSAKYVAMLLRLSYFEPTKQHPDRKMARDGARGRAMFWEKYGKYLYHTIHFGNPRPSFTGNGTDSVTTAWFIFNMVDKFKPAHTWATDWKRDRDND